MTQIVRVGDVVVDSVGDKGRVVRSGSPAVARRQTYIFADPEAEGPTFEPGPATVLVQWETLNGKPAFMQASWEDVGDLTLAKG